MLDCLVRVAARAGLAAIVLAPIGAFAATVPPGLVNTPNRPNQTSHAFKCQLAANILAGNYLKTWSKTYLKCVGAIASCVETKASDAKCLSKAVAKCNAAIPPLADDLDTDAGTTLENGVVDFCGSLSPTEAFDDAGGPQFGLLDTPCHDRFGFHLSFIQGYSFCLFRETNCVAERELLVGLPRARDLLASQGITVGHAVDPTQSCLTDEGGAGALPDAKAGKTLLACELKAAKAGASFAAKARAAFAKCTNAIMTCAQLKPTQKCIDGAAKACTKQVASIDDKQAKLAGSIAKTCGKVPLDDLTGAAGGDVGALASLCTSVGVNTLDSLDAYGDCLAHWERCQVEDTVEFTVPRVQEFLTATDQASPFHSSFCPAR